MNGVYLKLYAQENTRHGGRVVHEWLVDVALELGLPGCSVFRSITGYGHHRRKHDQDYIELQGTLPVEIVFALSEEEAGRLLQRLRDEKLELFFVSMPVQFGFTTC